MMRRDRRVADEQERAAVRTAETAAREATWATAHRERAAAESSAAAAAVAALGAQVDLHESETPRDGRSSPGAPDAGLAAAMDRLRALTERRRQLAASALARAQQREAAVDRRRRAEVALAIDESRLQQIDGEVSRLVATASDASQRATEAGTRLAAASAEEDGLAEALVALLRGSGDERGRMLAAERSAVEHREQLRTAEGRSRSAEVSEMEARLGADAVREQLLVELAGIGGEGLAALLEQATSAPMGATEAGQADTGRSGRDATASGPRSAVNGLEGNAAEFDAETLPAALESALDAALAAWQATRRGPEAAPPGISAGRLAALRRRYHDLGASNPFAAEEYAEVRQRLETLDTQRVDLEGAIRATRELIGQLSDLISARFRATFAALEGAFGRRFQQLFDGGEAQLLLTDPDDLSRTGVEITARPPGKKRQPLAMLSGGERALTAVALLMAMLEVRPVPFCVLDEVDAALDEANIGRFSAALRTLAERIQFIVITHNRGTIEAADALYGVTVDDDAVSRVVSLRLGELDEASLALAAPRG